ncbi:MAG TPA: dTDP-4-dehydrorhamnose reductase [Candidatus Eisenbacteria bacterium]|nr:dTDP-4-dehydrorhamnose reductase [Candidatus Eisenbacteria bacterium]
MRILVTGAGGLIGRFAAARFARRHEVVALRRPELDVTDATAIRRMVAEVRPSLLINCAVLQVDNSERDPDLARAVNVDGPRFLAESAASSGAEIVHFGSQYAFRGEPVGRAPYTVWDEPDPVNVYGETKVAGERAVLRACARSYIVRTSWVYGRGKESFLCTVADDLRNGKRVRAIEDIWSCTTYVEDLLDRLTEILARGHYGNYHVVNEGACSYYEFALEAGRLLGLDAARVDSLIEVVKESAMERAAARPRFTPMRCVLSEELGFAPMRHWRDALAAYVGRA